jgi:hypothetical protein
MPPRRNHARSARRDRDEPIQAPRVPPHSIDAEQAVLGGLMLAPDALDKVADKLAELDFYRKDHRLIWRAINELANKGMPCDAVIRTICRLPDANRNSNKSGLG